MTEQPEFFPKKVFLEGNKAGKALEANDRWLKLADTVKLLGGFVSKACYDALSSGSVDFFHPEIYQEKQKYFFNKRHWKKPELIKHYSSLPEDKLNYSGCFLMF